MPLTGSDTFSVRGWINDLTYAEIHAMAYGGVHGAATVLAYALGTTLAIGLLRDISLGLVGVFIVLNGWCKTERTQAIPLVGQILAAIPSDIRAQIRGELHYYDVPYLLLAALAAAVAYGLGWI